MKNLVMGVAKGYGWHDLEPFVISCRKNCPDADLVLFVDDLSDFTMSRLKENGVEIPPIPDDLKSEIIVTSRFKMYKNFLDAHSEYDRVFFTDVRDVIFQGDIFKSYADYENFLVYATEGQLIKNDKANNNQNWLKQLFGESEYQKIKDNNAVCGGTLYGSREEIKIFFASMMKFFKTSAQWGDDQAAMNYLVHNRLLPIKNLIESDINTGEILTTIYSINFSNSISGDKILRGDGGVPAVVHQWPGHAYFVQLVDKVYRKKDFKLDGRFLDARSSLDQTLCLAQCHKWVDATKIFISNAFFSDLEGLGEVYLKIWQLTLQAQTPNFGTETLSVAVQSKIPAGFSKNIKLHHMENIYAAYAFSEKTRRAINPALRIFVANMTLRFAEIFQSNGRMDLSLKYLERAARMNMLATLNAT